jgi:hypothetical protein
VLRRVRNIVLSGWGWSFRLGQVAREPKVAVEGEEIRISSLVTNDGLRCATAYIRVLTADSYDLRHPIFDSNRDLPKNTRQSLRLLDIKAGDTRQFVCSWQLPQNTANRHFDSRVQVWNPHLLFGGPYPYKFDDTGWIDGFEVVGRENSVTRSPVFISYSWDNEGHIDWVRSLAEELQKYNIEVVIDQRDLSPGQETTHFMETGIRSAGVCLLICSTDYVRKANDRAASGVGYETIITTKYYLDSVEEDRKRFIPIIRNNSRSRSDRLPAYLGNAFYIDMEGEQWRAKPLAELVRAIRRCTGCRDPSQ